MLFDTHAHLDDRAFDTDREALIAALPEAGIGLLVNPGCSLLSSKAACALAERYPFIYAAVGSHPDAADEVTENLLDAYRQLVRENPKVVAIGEIGLDYHYEDIPREIQKRAFRMQLELARELKLPVIVHEREDLIGSGPKCLIRAVPPKNGGYSAPPAKAGKPPKSGRSSVGSAGAAKKSGKPAARPGKSAPKGRSSAPSRKGKR